MRHSISNMSSLRTLFNFILFILIMSIALIYPLSAHAKSITVKAKEVKVRSGAGNYYEVFYIVKEGTILKVLEERDRWYKIELPDHSTGFVSKKALAKRSMKPGQRRYDKYDKGVEKVASSEIMAATKGVTDLGLFAKRYAKKRDIDTSIFEELEDLPFSATEYNVFKSSLPQKKRVKARGLNKEGLQPYDRDVGEAIAVRLCSVGISKDKNLRKYISIVGTAATENTPLYDESFIFIVLDSPRIASFAAPGGYIFITTGALEQMKNEAELAGVLSHEIVHVVNRHGISEIEEQKTRIQSDIMMESLGEEVAKLKMDKGDEKLFEELDDMTDSIYELLISGRKRASEDESDRLGTIILYNTGYSPDGLKQFIINAGKASKDQKDSTYSHYSYEERSNIIDKVIKKKDLEATDEGIFEERFKRSIK
ncbi:MAG: M48 family metalloprotease [Thermodesulfovibrionales bacterium]